jgi:hypothetical protein
MPVKHLEQIHRQCRRLAILLVGLGLATSLSAQQLILSSDQFFSFGGDPVFDTGIWYQSGLGTQAMVLMQPGLELESFHYDLDRGALFGTVGHATKLLDGTTVTPRDILQLGLSITLETSGEALGLPEGAKIDALYLDGGEWIVSLDRPTMVAGEIIRDSDLVRLMGGGAGVEIVFSAVDQGLPIGLDIDGAHIKGDDIYLSFDQAGRLPGLDFNDHSVIVYSTATETWRLHHDAASEAGFPSFAGMDVDALSITPEIFGDSFESGSLARWSSVNS